MIDAISGDYFLIEGSGRNLAKIGLKSAESGHQTVQIGSKVVIKQKGRGQKVVRSRGNKRKRRKKVVATTKREELSDCKAIAE
jgi:hypothetical protein